MPKLALERRAHLFGFRALLNRTENLVSNFLRDFLAVSAKSGAGNKVK
jgi:hypothetical protein